MILVSREKDEALIKSMKEGDVVLVLGAGVTYNSMNRSGRRPPLGPELASKLCELAGIPYTDGDHLSEVCEAVQGISGVGTEIFKKVIKKEFTRINPSKEQIDLLRYCWARIYTFNVDDSFKNVGIPRSKQIIKFYNGIIDKVNEGYGVDDLQFVYLHGEADKPEHGLVFSETEYTRQAIETKPWYKQAGNDYLGHTVLIIGTSLDEPLFKREIERARHENGAGFGRSFLITPDDISAVKKASFESKGIFHIKNTFEGFSKWLQHVLPNGVDKSSVVSLVTGISNISKENAKKLQYLRPVEKNKIQKENDRSIKAEANRFLLGAPPEWKIIQSNVPEWLTCTRAAADAFAEAILKHEKLIVITGQAGSGKSTAAMMSAMDYARNNDNALIFDLLQDAERISEVFEALSAVYPDNLCIVLIRDIFSYGSGLRDDVERLKDKNIVIVTTARSGEWKEHYQRYLGNSSKEIEVTRFSKNDYSKLISLIENYVAAPAFNKLSYEEKTKRLDKSKLQLLFALREVTESRTFDVIMDDEYSKLPDSDTKAMAHIASVATIARSGVKLSMAREAYESLGAQRSFERAIDALAGIVDIRGTRMYFRHDIYARHVLKTARDFSHFRDSVNALLASFSKFECPIINNVSRTDYHLFKFLLRNDFIMEFSNHYQVKKLGAEIYENFEINFQLDGHFWLQYGLYMKKLGEIDRASDLLRKSINAYPQNDFAHHAHAGLLLEQSMRRKTFDSITESLIKEAEETLLRLDAKESLEDDTYPIVTLANSHVGALVHHNQVEQARKAATRYFDRLQQLAKRSKQPAVEKSMTRIMNFVSRGDWSLHAPNLQPSKKTKDRFAKNRRS